MNCTEAREAMLVAEPAEFRAEGGAGSELAAHVGECEVCRSLAGALAEDLDRLSSRIRARSRRRTLMIAALPIAAVVVATVTVVAKRADQPIVAVQARTDRPASVVSIEVGVGQQATVIKTADPKTTLVWISSGSN
jgi:L-alanine-DL-glutamate epimerase-like enolase superfamily enzyme